MKPPHIVIVTYNWPPRNAIGTHRPYSWAKYWSEAGANVTVLTAKKCSFDEPLDLQLPQLPGVVVVEVPYNHSGTVAVGVLRFMGLVGILKRVKRLFSRYIGISVDIREQWARAALTFAGSLAKEAEVVVSTYGPVASHLIASEMKCANPQLYWVADYRDLWSQNHLAELPRWARRREHQRELQTVGSLADRVTTVSEELAGDLSGLLGRSVDVLMNGFDIDEQALKSNLAECNVKANDRPLRIVYTGMIYPNRRDPRPLLQAIFNLSRRGLVTSQSLVVEFYGSRAESAENIVSRSGVSEFVHFMGHVPRADALQAQTSAHFVLLLESGAPDAKGMLTGKLFEYIASGTPVLSLGSAHDSAISRVLSQCGCGVCVQEDLSAIEKILMEALRGEKPEWYRPNLEQILKYSRQKQALSMYTGLILTRGECA